jgi:hypothetical protein
MDEYNIEPNSGAPTCNFDQLGHRAVATLYMDFTIEVILSGGKVNWLRVLAFPCAVHVAALQAD